jgi:hypothetical protein
VGTEIACVWVCKARAGLLVSSQATTLLTLSLVSRDSCSISCAEWMPSLSTYGPPGILHLSHAQSGDRLYSWQTSNLSHFHEPRPSRLHSPPSLQGPLLDSKMQQRGSPWSSGKGGKYLCTERKVQPASSHLCCLLLLTCPPKVLSNS